MRKSEGHAAQPRTAIGPAPGFGPLRSYLAGPPTARRLRSKTHPHASQKADEIAVVHNGIIENHEQLRQNAADGCVFQSQTDSEVTPNLLKKAYDGRILAAVRKVIPQLEGSFAFAAIFEDHPGKNFVARQGSPLLVGLGKDQMLLASDIPALLPHAHEYTQLEDGQMAVLSRKDCDIFDFDGKPLEVNFKQIEMNVESVSKGDFDSFMSKEIAEQSEVLERLLDSRMRGDDLADPDLGIDLSSINHIVFLCRRHLLARRPLG